jgi:hypothetical protein
MKQLIENTKTFETHVDARTNHPLALQDKKLGVHKIKFTDNFKAMLFETMEIDPLDVRKASMGIYELNVGAIVRDTYNQLSAWTIHLIKTSKLGDERLRYSAELAVMKMLNYKYFTSLFFKRLKYCDEAVMTETIEGLSGSFNLIKYGSWGATIEARSEAVIGPDSKHYPVLMSFAPDPLVGYFLSDTQGSIRGYVQEVLNRYYDLKIAQSEGIKLYSTTSEVDGEKLIRNFEDTLNVMSRGVANEILNASAFIDGDLITKLTEFVGNFRADMFRSLIVHFHDTANSHSRAGKYFLYKDTPKGRKYEGLGAVVKDLLRVTYRYLEKTDLEYHDRARFRTKVLINTRNAYSASRTSEQDILTIKSALDVIINESLVTSRDSTKTSLRTALILYFMVKSFKYL